VTIQQNVDRIRTTHIGSLPWEKLKALRQGAGLASKRLWARQRSAE
jgi:hypothetical protein